MVLEENIRAVCTFFIFTINRAKELNFNLRNFSNAALWKVCMSACF